MIDAKLLHALERYIIIYILRIHTASTKLFSAKTPHQEKKLHIYATHFIVRTLIYQIVFEYIVILSMCMEYSLDLWLSVALFVMKTHNGNIENIGGHTARQFILSGTFCQSNSVHVWIGHFKVWWLQPFSLIIRIVSTYNTITVYCIRLVSVFYQLSHVCYFLGFW